MRRGTGAGTGNASLSSPSHPSSFNSDTSHSQCGPSHEGLIAKTKVSQGAVIKAREIQGDSNLPLALLSYFITCSWCGERLARWPQAQDSKSTLSLQSEFEKLTEKYEKGVILSSIEHVSSSLPTWDPRIINSQITSLREEVELSKKSSPLSSPLFLALFSHYPQLSPESFEKCYNQHRGNFVASAIYLLRREFKVNPPPELSTVDGWSQRWPQYLPPYLKKWQKDLREIETKTLTSQREWKESIF